MKVLVVGNGGREHAIAWKLATSPHVSEVICCGENPGIAQVATCTGVPDGGVRGIARWARDQKVDLAVVGPEAYLDMGLVDALREAGVKAVGPDRKAAQLESSKAFAKELMARHHIPTASFAICESSASAKSKVREFGAPVVIKADGLAAGKGVTVAMSIDEADEAIDAIMEERLFGDAGSQVVVESFLEGEEASILAFVDGERIVPMVAAQDHKAVGEGDTGPNTGGMGAYSPTPVVTAEVEKIVMETIFKPIVAAMAKEGRQYRGILYAGLMITSKGPMVIEFNCRFGDPEAQAVLPRMKSDLLLPLLATAEGNLSGIEIEWDPRACVCVVMASKGYPGDYSTGMPISGLKEASAMEGVTLFHSGTRQVGEAIQTDGGRVLGVTAMGDSVEKAIEQAYKAVKKISFEGSFYRRDIGAKALKYRKWVRVTT